LAGIGADDTGDLYSASGYCATAGTAASELLHGRYAAAFGANAPVMGSVGQSIYEGVRCYAALAARAGSIGHRPITAAARAFVYHGGRGAVEVRGNEAALPIFLSEANGMAFRVIRTF